jgi:thiol-disulfide isomerase/thioredoxin
MTMSMRACLALAAAVAAPVLAYDSLEALIKDHRSRQLEAMRTYIADHPDAKDLDQAKAMVIVEAFAAGDYAAAIKLLDERYAKLIENRQEANIQRDLVPVVDPSFRARVQSGDKAGAKAFLERVRHDFEVHPDAKVVGTLLQRLEGQLARPAVGETLALKFKAIDGREVDLAAMKDKVVLVDFWATWCGPCRAELPNVKAVYAKYKDKGFEIVGISLDSDREKLDTFLKAEGMTWPQYFTGEGWKTDLAQDFGITSIPAMFLVGRDGKVAATDLRGSRLEARLDELLK